MRGRRDARWLASKGVDRTTIRYQQLCGCSQVFGRGTCKPNSVVCGHSSRRSVTAYAHQRPTRRFRQLHGAVLRQGFVAGRFHSSRLNASGRCAAPHGSLRQLPSLFGLAPCGVYPASVVTAGAVRSYRTFSPLPTGHPGICPSGQISVPKHEQPAVCSLWH